MASRPPTDERHVERQVDDDGVVRVIPHPNSTSGRWLIGLALGFTGLCLVLCAWLVRSEEPPSAPAPIAVTRPAPPPRPLSAPPPRAEPARPPAAPASPTAVTEQAPTPGPAEGLHLYRQGTKPLKQGLVVPEGFALPEGYVRHYQSSDDGEPVKPILMFHPDYHPVDANGRPVELPANRVVPPELAPPGMPLEVLELPAGPEGVEPLP